MKGLKEKTIVFWFGLILSALSLAWLFAVFYQFYTVGIFSLTHAIASIVLLAVGVKMMRSGGK